MLLLPASSGQIRELCSDIHFGTGDSFLRIECQCIATAVTFLGGSAMWRANGAW
jgi:hypothetical protein